MEQCQTDMKDTPNYIYAQVVNKHFRAGWVLG